MKKCNFVHKPDEIRDFAAGHIHHKTSREETWNRRYLKQWGIMLSIDGAGTVASDKDALSVSKRDLLIYHPEVPLIFTSVKTWHYLWAHFDLLEHIREEFVFKGTIPSVVLLQLPPKLYRTILRDMLEVYTLESQRHLENWHALAYNLVENILIRASELNTSGKRTSPPLKQALGLLSRPQSMLVMDDIARLCGMSRSKFYAAFKREFGCSPRDYREDVLMHRARRLLENTNFSLGEIAAQLGINDPYYFAARFKKTIGIPPGRFRKLVVSTRPPKVGIKKNG